MRVLGMISGTSHDGIDAAVVEFTHTDQQLHGRVLATSSTPYSGELRARLIAALPPAQVGLDEVARIDRGVGIEFGAVASALAEQYDVDLVVSHGQTVFHLIEHGRALTTLQLGQPAFIAAASGRPVLADVRIADIAAGGQGAPLVSVLDQLLFGDGPATVALNLGGIANITVVRPGSPTIAYDTGPANALMDAVVTSRGLHPRGFDVDGAIAASGTVDQGLLEVMLADPYFSAPWPKSTGKEHFHGGLVDELVAAHSPAISDQDLMATLLELTARTVADAVAQHRPERLVSAGGGCRNGVLMARIEELLPGLTSTDVTEFGVAADDKEAVAFALIGWLSAHGLPATVPSATGADHASVLGALTPGASGWGLAEQLQQVPQRLVLSTDDLVADALVAGEAGTNAAGTSA